jgi:single-strand DNA-binding protein
MLNAHLVGNLGQDPEPRYSAEGRPVLTFRVASNYRLRTPEGTWTDCVEWVRVRVVGRRAESLSTLLRKGSRVYVDGRLEARSWLNNQQPQAGLELLANDVELMGPRQDDRGANPSRWRAAPGRSRVRPARGAGSARRTRHSTCASRRSWSR